MIVLDTNVVSELYKPIVAAPVAAWFSVQPKRSIYVCAPVMAEVRYGVVKLPPGRKRDLLAARYARIVDEFRSQIFSFDLRAAEAFAELLVARAAAGAPIQPNDAQIAAIAKARNAAVATRDISDFSGCGVALIDPWAHAG
ncbi:MAG: type II toxin-antitoxin system VapC family toxin [Vitreimonas sp.]